MSSADGRRSLTTSATRRGGVGALACAVLFAIAVGVVVLVGSGRQPVSAGDSIRPSVVPVDHLVRVCPGAASPGGDASNVLVGSAPVEELGSQGRVRQGAMGSDDRPSRIRVERGQLTGTGTGDGTPVVVEADGELAAGLFSYRVDTKPLALAVTQCESPAADWWFAGAGATSDHDSDLVISNVDPDPAVVDVRVFGPNGEIETIGTRGITIASDEQTSIRIADVAPQSEELSVSVMASRGRVVAAVADSYAAGAAAARGEEWLPAQHEPGRLVRLAGLPARADSRSLLVTNPSESEALVKLEVAGENGTFAPAETSEFRVPPGSVVSTDISRVVTGEDVAVRLSSQLPVVATLRSTTDGDVTYAAPVDPLTGPAAAPLVVDAGSRLLISAVDAAARATVTTYTSDGTQVESIRVEVPAGATSAYQPKKRAAYLVVTPGGKGVYGALSVSGDAGVSQIPLVTLPIRLRQPVVRPVVR